MSNISQLTSTDRQKLLTIMNEAVASLQRIEDERGALNDLLADTATKFDIEKPNLAKLARHMHKRDYGKHKDAMDELDFLYSSLVGDED